MTNAEQNPIDETQPPIDGSPSGGHLVSTPRSGDGQLTGQAPRTMEIQVGAGVNLREYWRIVKKRKWLIGSIISAFVMIGWLQTLMSIPQYTSAVRIQIDRSVSKIIENGSVTPSDSSDGDFLRTQYELLQSRSLAERVVSMARLGNDTAFLKPKQFSLLGMFRGGDKSAAQADKSIGSADRAAAARRRRSEPPFGSASFRLAPGRHYIYRRLADGSAKNRPSLRRGVHRLHPRQAVPGEFLREDFS